MENIATSDLPLVRVANYAGISYQTFRNWMRNGEEHKHRLEKGEIKKSDLTTKQKHELDLFLRVDEANIKKEQDLIKTLKEYAADKKDVKAIQWLLKRRHKVYHDDVPDDEGDGDVKRQEVFVFHLFGKTPKDRSLINQGLYGSTEDAEAEKARTDDSTTKSN